MNYLDYVIIGVLVVSAFMGMRTGLIEAALTAVGVYIGWLLAGQYSYKGSELITDTVQNDTAVTVISYGVIIVAAVIVSSIAAKFIRPLLTVFTLGLSSMVDKIGGLVMGLVIGVAIAGAVILGMARFTYNFNLLGITDALPSQVAEAMPVQVGDQLAQLQDRRKNLEDALAGSQLVPVFIDITDALPADALGYIPTDFKAALELVKVEIEKKEAGQTSG